MIRYSVVMESIMLRVYVRQWRNNVISECAAKARMLGLCLDAMSCGDTKACLHHAVVVAYDEQSSHIQKLPETLRVTRKAMKVC